MHINKQINFPYSSTSSMSLPLITISEETLEELGLTFIHKKSKEKTKHLEPIKKKQGLNDDILDITEFSLLSEIEKEDKKKDKKL